MNILSTVSRFFNQNKNKQSDNIQVTRREAATKSFSQINLGSQLGDSRFVATEVLTAQRDPIVAQCMRILINTTLSNGHTLTAEKDWQRNTIEETLKKLDFKGKNNFILNSIIGSGGDVIAFFTESPEGFMKLNLESFFWNGYQRVHADIDESDKTFKGKFIVKNYLKESKFTVDINSSVRISSQNFENDYLGTTPLFLVANRVLEKNALSRLVKNTALKNGRLDGILTPPKDLLKDIGPGDRAEYLREYNDVSNILTTNDDNQYQNYALSPVPLDHIELQVSNDRMKTLELIKQINYEITSAFGVPPSLVHFDESTDPNLANAEQQKDNLVELVVNHYKDILEEFWSKIIKSLYPDFEFEIKIGREQTDESIELRQQLIDSVALCKSLNEVGINVRPKLESIEKLGLELVETTSNIEVINSAPNVGLVEEIEISTKTTDNAGYTELDPPNIEEFLKKKPFEQFKSELEKKLSRQLEIGLINLIKNLKNKSKTIDKNDLIYEYLLDNIPSFESVCDSKCLADLINQDLMPAILDEYNQFYNTSYSVQSLPKDVKETINSLIETTIQGNKALGYAGIDSTTIQKTLEIFNAIAKSNSINLDDYAMLSDKDKMFAWKQLKSQGKKLILESRTDLLSELMTEHVYNQTLEALSKVDNKGKVFVGVKTVRDRNVRGSHRINEGKYFESSLKKPWLDPRCRCKYIFGDEKKLKSLGFVKL